MRKLHSQLLAAIWCHRALVLTVATTRDKRDLKERAHLRLVLLGALLLCW